MGLTFPLDESNPDPRVACIVLADVSGSMMGEPIEALEKGFTQFVEYIQAPGLARKRAEVGVITFGSTADVVLPLRGAQELEPIRFTAGGSTNMAAAIHLGLDMIEERKAEYKASGIRYYRPWLLVLTDGEPNSAGFDEAVARLNQVEVAKGVTVFAVGVGEMANFTMLERLSRDRKPAPLAGLKFEEFFQWLSDSLSGMSSSGNHGSSDSEVASNSTEQVPLPPIAGWATA
ncbi:hypothetical protein Rruber_05548 (plasmid) [Rhodococcus ruber]|uniref:vWA domain-containing protein n=1 Tax=Rhodococcus ruber TaxID=1830 RepID=UPI00315C5ED1